jgi:hypothetical protein
MKTPRQYAEDALKNWPNDAPQFALLKEAILDVATKAVVEATEEVQKNLKCVSCDKGYPVLCRECVREVRKEYETSADENISRAVNVVLGDDKEHQMDDEEIDRLRKELATEKMNINRIVAQREGLRAELAAANQRARDASATHRSCVSAEEEHQRRHADDKTEIDRLRAELAGGNKRAGNAESALRDSKACHEAEQVWRIESEAKMGAMTAKLGRAVDALKDIVNHYRSISQPASNVGRIFSAADSILADPDSKAAGAEWAEMVAFVKKYGHGHCHTVRSRCCPETPDHDDVCCEHRPCLVRYLLAAVDERRGGG